MSDQSTSSWEDISTVRSDSDSSLEQELRAIGFYNQENFPNMAGPRRRDSIAASEASTDSGPALRFRPPGQGGAPLYSPASSSGQEQLDFTPVAPRRTETRGVASMRATARSFDALSRSSETTSTASQAEPMTPVRHHRSNKQFHATAESDGSVFNHEDHHVHHGNPVHHGHSTSMAMPIMTLGPRLPSVGLGDEKEQHPAYRAIRAQCQIGRDHIAALRQRLSTHPELGTNIRRLLDADMSTFSNLLAAARAQADLLANTIDENVEQHQTLKKMLASQTVDCERLNAKIVELYGSIEHIRQDHYLQIMKLQDQIKTMTIANSTMALEKATTPGHMGPGTYRGDRLNMGFKSVGNNVVSPPTFVAQTPVNFGGQSHRAASYAVSGPRFGPASSGRRYSTSYRSSGAARFNIDDGTPTRPSTAFRESNPSQALVQVVTSDEDVFIAEWIDRLRKLWVAVGAYCRTFVTGETKSLHLVLQNGAPNVWKYICDVLYPNNAATNGAAHAQTLLADVETRECLVRRLLIQYFINQLWCAEGWSQFNPETDDGLKQAEMRLLATGSSTNKLSMTERQAALDSRAQLIGRILMDTRFQEFRQFKLNQHVDRVKMIVGPMIASSQVRNDSQFDLYNLVSQAMELSAVLFESRRQFDWLWTDTCAKFVAEQHQATNTTMDPNTLQLQQWRLKLVITPGVGLRDERNPANQRHILKSDVLVMN